MRQPHRAVSCRPSLLILLLQVLVLCLPTSIKQQSPTVCHGLRWPRLPSKAATAQGKGVISKGKNMDNNMDDDQKGAASLSSLQLEPLLQIPCAIQLTKNLSDASDQEGRQKRAIGTFVDTGAQRTCMSWQAAKRAGLGHLLDRRYAGQATGVGLCRVLGRIPAQTVIMHFSGSGSDDDDDDDITIMAPAITILESTGTEGVDLLLGLDFLRDTDAVIDIPQERIRLTGVPARNNKKKKKDTRTIVVLEVSFIRPRQSISVTATTATTTTTKGSPITLKKSVTNSASSSNDGSYDIGDDDEEEEEEDYGSDGEEGSTPLNFSGI